MLTGLSIIYGKLVILRAQRGALCPSKQTLVHFAANVRNPPISAGHILFQTNDLQRIFNQCVAKIGHLD